ncbi:NTF2-like N-terminal transpeptidase domain-containing protein, partial [Nocardia abscessus]|uniref:NTF2-like N-terminal transpeptidase domain-containing protein n=1 Tax=Nocardia abscessus TaxID=120957 RepID=UPI002458DA67
MRTNRKSLVLFAAPMLVLAACSSGPDQPDTVAGQFAEALNRDDVAAAAALTDNPALAADTLGALYEGLGKDVRFEVRSADENGFALAATWKLGGDGKSEWTYTTNGTAGDDGSGWRVKWDPATVAPGLGAGPLSYSRVYPKPARILDSTGGELMTEQIVTLVNVGPGADLAAVADLLGPLAPGLTAPSLQAELTGAQGKSITAITLRESDLAPVRDRLTALPGVVLAPQTRLLTTDKTLAAPTLSGLAELWQESADANAGWAVRAQTPEGTQRVAGTDPTPTADIATTLDLGLQRAAEAALVPVAQPAAMVAQRPWAREVVAVAQNPAAAAPGPIAQTGG